MNAPIYHLRRLAHQYRELANLADADGRFGDAADHAEVALMFEEEVKRMEGSRKPAPPSDPFVGFRD